MDKGYLIKFILASTSRAMIASSDGSGSSSWLGLCLLLTTAPPRGEQESHHTHSDHWNVVVEPEIYGKLLSWRYGRVGVYIILWKISPL